MESIDLSFSLPPSAKLVLRILRDMKITDFKKLQDETGLSRRTLMYSIKLLKDINAVETRIFLHDAIRRFYCIKLRSD